MFFAVLSNIDSFMAKNYSQDKSVTSEWVPSKYVIQRILAFSKAYQETQEEKDPLDLLKN